MQLRLLVEFQRELEVGYSKLVAISTDSWRENAALRTGLGAAFPFLSDEERIAQQELGSLEVTSRRKVDLPRDYVLYPDLTIYKVYNGYYYWGRVTPQELREDFRAVSSQIRKDWDPMALNEQSLVSAYTDFMGYDPLGPHPHDPR